jgi:hypothetical protein
MEERPKLSLERYREIVPEWSPRPPMTERLLAALAAAFAHPDKIGGRIELLWMAVGMKPAGQYEIGELVSWASHWRIDEREAGRGRFGAADPERLRAWREKISEARLDPASQALVDELDEALREAGWRTWRDPEHWGECWLCPGELTRGCLSSNLVAVSDMDAARLSLALRTASEVRPHNVDSSNDDLVARDLAIGQALGFPMRSIGFYLEDLIRTRSSAELERHGAIDRTEMRHRQDERQEIRYEKMLGWPDELFPYVYFIGDPKDIPIVAEARRRAEALFGGLPAGTKIVTPRERVEEERRFIAEMTGRDEPQPS